MIFMYGVSKISSEQNIMLTTFPGAQYSAQSLAEHLDVFAKAGKQGPHLPTRRLTTTGCGSKIKKKFDDRGASYGHHLAWPLLL